MPCHTHTHIYNIYTLDKTGYNHLYRLLLLNMYVLYFYLIGTKKLRQAQFIVDVVCCLRCKVSNKQV
jgi:hypothetical protein